MRRARCFICFHRVPAKALKYHLLKSHPKSKVIKQFLKCKTLQTVVLKKKRKKILKKTETVTLNEDVQIICRDNEIIIGNETNSLGIEFNVNESLLSEDSVSVDERICQRENNRKCYKINITKIGENLNFSLDENTGGFYICNCKDNTSPSPSDTELPSETYKLFCQECGASFDTETELDEHKIGNHSNWCKLCKEIFPTMAALREHFKGHLLKVYVCFLCQAEFIYRDNLKLHLDAHVEENVYNTVLDMEEDYRITRYHFSVNYNDSINSILAFLTDHQDYYYGSYKFAKFVCDICYHEVFVCDYEQHLHTAHYPYTF